jgi:hypothetical protein
MYEDYKDFKNWIKEHKKLSLFITGLGLGTIVGVWATKPGRKERKKEAKNLGQLTQWFENVDRELADLRANKIGEGTDGVFWIHAYEG